jgi:hypothetical protein
MAADPSDIEIRGYLPRDLIDLMDAIVIANPGLSRIDLIRRVMGKWAERKRHEAILIGRLSRSNGTRTEAGTRPTGKAQSVPASRDFGLVGIEDDPA